MFLAYGITFQTSENEWTGTSTKLLLVCLAHICTKAYLTSSVRALISIVFVTVKWSTYCLAMPQNRSVVVEVYYAKWKLHLDLSCAQESRYLTLRHMTNFSSLWVSCVSIIKKKTNARKVCRLTMSLQYQYNSNIALFPVLSFVYGKHSKAFAQGNLM